MAGVESFQFLDRAKKILDASCEFGKFDQLQKSCCSLGPMITPREFSRVFADRFLSLLFRAREHFFVNLKREYP